MIQLKDEEGRVFHWYSICSRHAVYSSECNLCNTGQWVNVREVKRDQLFYRLCPWLWRLWVNRANSPQRKRIEQIFPNLKY